MDRAGRLVIPKPLRKEIGLAEGGQVEIGIREGRIVIEPVVPEIRLENADGRPVFRSNVELPLLTIEEVRRLLEQQRRSSQRTS